MTTATPPRSLLAIGAKRGEEGSLTFNGDTTILTRPQQAGSHIVKEHSQGPARDAQIVRPSTTVSRLWSHWTRSILA